VYESHEAGRVYIAVGVRGSVDARRLVRMAGEVRITIRAKPRAKRSRVTHTGGLSADVAIAAMPVEGAANEELVRVLAAALAVPKRALRLVLGGASKNKVVEVTGLTEAEVVERLAKA
jgi:uncharacterized protein YggU (UPF0235/DUF167 family)